MTPSALMAAARLEAFGFGSPWALVGLAVLPLLWWRLGRHGGGDSLRFPGAAECQALGRRAGVLGGWPRLVGHSLALALLVIGLARPQWGESRTRIRASGVDIFLVLDVSSSMEAMDFSVGGERATRVAAVREVTRQFVRGRPSDRLGLIAFAGRPYEVSPLTLDHGWLNENLERVEIGLVGEDGTAIGSAIAAAGNRLKDRESRSRIVVLLTDGTNNGGKIEPLTAAEAASALGIRVYTIGAGTRGKAPVPIRDETGEVRLQWRQVVFDEDTLRAIAERTGGRYFRATDTASLEQIYREIDALEKTEERLDVFENRDEWYPWLVGPGLGLLLLVLLLEKTTWRSAP